MRLIPNVGSSRVYDELAAAASLDIAARSVSIHGVAIAARVAPLRRLLLSSAVSLQWSDFDRSRRNGLILRSEARLSLRWLANAGLRVFPLHHSMSSLTVLSPVHNAAVQPHSRAASTLSILSSMKKMASGSICTAASTAR